MELPGALSGSSGKGLLMTFNLAKTSGADLTARCLEDGLLINAPKEKSIRLVPPLVVTEDEIIKMFDIMIPHLALG